MFFQAVRQEVISLRNIVSTWRAAGVKPYNPLLILLKYRPKTPLFVSFTNEDGRRINIQVQPDVGQKINEFMDQLLRVCPTPYRPKVAFITDTALTTITDRTTL